MTGLAFIEPVIACDKNHCLVVNAELFEFLHDFAQPLIARNDRIIVFLQILAVIVAAWSGSQKWKNAKNLPFPYLSR